MIIRLHHKVMVVKSDNGPLNKVDCFTFYTSSQQFFYSVSVRYLDFNRVLRIIVFDKDRVYLMVFE